MTFSLKDFVAESNRIEGITSSEELATAIEAHNVFLACPPTIETIKEFVWAVATARMRDKQGLDVVVGSHRPLPGGARIYWRLRELIDQIDTLSPYKLHQKYERLHPFMDGNGRSGRALWLYQMGGIARAPLGFLHHWYYQSLKETQ